MMVLVALAAMASWWTIGRRSAFLRLAAEHERGLLDGTTTESQMLGSQMALIQHTTPLAEWHRILMVKYRTAAARPWLPVGPNLAPPRHGEVLIVDPFDLEAEPRFGPPAERARVRTPPRG